MRLSDYDWKRLAKTYHSKDKLSMNEPISFANTRVVLSHPSHPGNIGAAARAMKTMGLARLVLINPKHFPDPVAEARASGAADVLAAARTCATLDEALEGTVLVAALTSRQRDFAPPTFSLRDAMAELANQARQQEVALLFGTEMSGLRNSELEKCHMRVEIPTAPAYPSLNLAAAVQVAAYELRMASLAATGCSAVYGELAVHEEIEGFYQHLEQALIASGFLDPTHPKKLMTRLRQLFSRTRLEKDEVNILRGILKCLRNS